MRSVFIGLLTLLVVTACSGVEIIPDDTAAFAASGFTRYAWRSKPPSKDSYAASRLYQADETIRESVDSRLEELGYERVSDHADAQFLVEYLAAVGFNDGQLSRGASNVTPYPSTTINRRPDQASVDNAYALSGVRETGNVLLVFVDARSTEPLWRVRISQVIEDANRVNSSAIKRAMRQGLSTIPAVP